MEFLKEVQSMTSEESDPDHEYDDNSFSESFSVWSKEK